MKKLFLSAALLPFVLAAAVPAVSVWNLGKEEPHIYLSLYDVKKQKASYEAMPDGQKALKIDLSQSLRGTWDGRFRSYRYLPDFTEATLKVRYFVPEKCGVSRVTVVLCDRNNEQFPLDFRPDLTPGWHEKSFLLNSKRVQLNAWATSIRAGHAGKKYDSGGKLNFYDQPMRVIGINGASPVEKKDLSHWIGFGAMTLEVKSSEGAIRPRLKTGTTFHVLKKGDEAKLALAFFNPEEAAYSGSVDVTVTDAYGKIVEKKSVPVEAAGGATARVALKVPQKYGVYKVITTSRAKGKKALDLTQSFCYMDPVGATPGVRAEGFLFSIDTHFPQWRIDAETEAEAIALCGTKIVRENTCWVGSQFDPSLPLSQAFTDDALEPFEKLGVEFQPTLLYPPKWAIDFTVKPIWPEKQDWPKYCPKADLWRDYCRKYFLHTKGRMRFYEVWNEADIQFANFGWEPYINLQRIAFEELRKVDPSAKLLTNGFACPPGGGQTDRNHFQKTVKDKGSYDIVAFHGHNLYPQYRQSIDLVTKTIDELAPGKPWYANETAMTSTITGEFEQGVQLFKKLLYSWAKGAIGYTWYDFRNDGYDLTYTEHNFGMVTRDFYPKVVYAVFNTLAKHLTDAKFVKALSDEPSIEGYLFRAKSGDLYCAFWGWKKCEITYALKNVTGRASLIDLFGNEKPLEVQNNCVILPVNMEGQFLRLQGAKELPLLAGEVMAPAVLPLAAEAGRTTSITMTVANPLPAAAKLGWVLVPPRGIAVEPARLTLALAPGEKRNVTLQLSAPKGTAAEQLSGVVRMTQLLNGRTILVSALPVIAVANAISDGDVFPLAPHFVINKPENLLQIDISPDSIWFGPKDGSAEVRLARVRNLLHLCVDVTDNIFCQPYTGFECFQGDNVQFFFALPGQQGFWEFGLSKTANGTEKWCYNAPVGQAKFTTFQARISPLADGGLRYEAWLPMAALGLSNSAGTSGFRFNCYVNDNDGKGRKDYLGIFTEKLPDRWPMVFFR